MSNNPHRTEMLELLRRADCHYGNTLRDDELGWTVEHAARQRDVQPNRITDLRERIRVIVLEGEVSRTKTRANQEATILRALLNFRGAMSTDLQQHVDARLARLKADFVPDLRATPLQCTNRGATPRAQVVSHERVCECGLTHAGECW